MSRILLSHLAARPLREYLLSQGHTLHILEDDPRYGPGVEAHADLSFCKLGTAGPVLSRKTPPLSPAYPDNASMCALVLDGFLVHRLDITDGNILQYCRDRGYRLVNVRQGYAKCACVPLDGRSVVTSDPGIYRALSRIPELDVWQVREGFVTLPGFDTGFLGGASGRVGDEILFNGDLSRHPDFERICELILSRGLKPRFFRGLDLLDIGSIIELEEC